MTTTIFKTKLKNGLSVLLKEIHTAPLISSWIWYRVGSRNEIPGQTGVSHWVEHMQFKGTEKHPAREMDKSISRVGGVWNAFTSLDWTTFLETLPSEKIDLALSLESDRMSNSLFDPEEVASERTVVISEREGSENEPLFQLSEAVQKSAFHIHPYQHEVIGEKSDLRSLSRDDLYQHYRKNYIPNNAILAMAGDFNTQTILDQIEGYFEMIPAGMLEQVTIPIEPPSQEEKRIELEGPGDTTYLQIAHRFPSVTDPDLFPFMVLDSLLSGPTNPSAFSGGGISNKTSRLYRRLVEQELAVGISGGGQITIDPYLYTTTITVRPGVKIDDALQAFSDEINRILDQPAPQSEIQRAIKQARAIFAYGTENITHQAAWLGFAEAVDEYAWFETYLDKLAQVTPQDILQVARKWLIKENRLIGVYRPDGKVVQ